MFFTKIEKGFRGWFVTKTSGGKLKGGIPPQDFTVTIVNQDDSSNTVVAVSESAEKSGLYFYDIPFSFLSLLGEYGVVVEVNHTTHPNPVVDAFSKILKVTQEDWDSLSGSFAEAIWDVSASEHNASNSFGWTLNQTFSTSSQTLMNTENITTDLTAVVSATVSGVNVNFNSISNVVSGIWNANTGTFNAMNTMGYLQNLTSDIKADTSVLLDDSLLIISGTNQILSNTNQLLFDATSLIVSSGQIFNNTTDALEILASGSVNITSTSIDTIVSGTWLAASASFDVSGTMGWLQNKIGATEISASVEVDNAAIANAVWSTMTASITAPGTFGYVLGNLTQDIWDKDIAVNEVSGSSGLVLRTLAGHIKEIYQIMGLEPGAPMTVSQTLRTVAAISQSIDGDPLTSVTVTRL